MLSRVARTIRRQGLLSRGDGVLVAVSGGPDSMALLAALWELAPRLGIRLEVASVDHGLRAEAAGEIALVAERAAALGLPHHVVRVDVAGARARVRGGIQETARRLRLAALSQLAGERGLARVALGHHADDQAETILFRIVRGTGWMGLAGIPYRRDELIRPLLDVTRAEVLRYLRRRALPFVTDPSNQDRRFARVRIREDVLPLLRRENPRVDEALRSLARTARAHLGDEPARHIEDVQRIAAEAGVRITRATAAAAADARRAGGTRSFDVEGGRLTVAYGDVNVVVRAPSRRGHSSARASGEPFASATMAGPGEVPVGDGRTLAMCERRKAPTISNDPAASDDEWAWFDYERIAWPLTVRRPQVGDRMRPRGGTGGKRLSRLLIDAKVPKEARSGYPVVVSADGEILFVPGLRPSERARPDGKTQRWMGVTVTVDRPSVD